MNTVQTFFFHGRNEFWDRAAVIIFSQLTHSPIDSTSSKFYTLTWLTSIKINVFQKYRENKLLSESAVYNCGRKAGTWFGCATFWKSTHLIDTIARRKVLLRDNWDNGFATAQPGTYSTMPITTCRDIMGVHPNGESYCLQIYLQLFHKLAYDRITPVTDKQLLPLDLHSLRLEADRPAPFVKAEHAEEQTCPLLCGRSMPKIRPAQFCVGGAFPTNDHATIPTCPKTNLARLIKLI